MGAALLMPALKATAAGAAPPVLLVVGDSLSAEYGLPRNSGWVKLLETRLSAGKVQSQYSVVNASISGDTSSGGRTRLPALLREHHPAIVIIELGANDGLRGLDPAAMQENLQAMILACRAQGARVLLVGIHVPPNYGPAYGERFYAVFPVLAQKLQVPLVPFLLEGFADQLDWFQADHIHPLPRAQQRILENVWTPLEPLLHTRTENIRQK